MYVGREGVVGAAVGAAVRRGSVGQNSSESVMRGWEDEWQRSQGPEEAGDLAWIVDSKNAVQPVRSRCRGEAAVRRATSGPSSVVSWWWLICRRWVAKGEGRGTRRDAKIRR